MTDQRPIATTRAVRVGADATPPYAPMIMPKQMLVREPGAVRRGFAAALARIVPRRSGVRRTG